MESTVVRVTLQSWLGLGVLSPLTPTMLMLARGGGPRRRHPNVVTNNLQSTPKTEGIPLDLGMSL